MIAALVAQIIQEERRPVDELSALFILAVDYSKRIFIEPVPAVVAQLGQMRPEEILQLLMVSFPAGRASYAVDIEAGLFQPQLFEKHVERLITSTSISDPAAPKASTPNWWNSLYLPFGHSHTCRLLCRSKA